MHHFNADHEPSVKTRARSTVRQILLSIVITTVIICAWMPQIGGYPPNPFSGSTILSALILAIPVGFVGWLILRVLWFALGPSLRSRPLRHSSPR